MTPPRRVLITGASGYIGTRLVERAVAAGLEVVAGVRHPERYRKSGVRAVGFDLSRADTLGEALDGIDAIVHLAAVIPERGGTEDVNVSGTRRLVEAARRAGVRRFVFASSHSARQDSPTLYGRTKWAIERMLEPERGEIAARLGLVCGGSPRGVYGRLARLCRNHRLLPMIGASAAVHPIDLTAACDELLALACGASVPRETVWIGRTTSVRFADFLHVLSRERFGRRLRLIPLPSLPVRALCRLAEVLPFLSLPTERIRGLLALPVVDAVSWRGATRDYRELLAAEGARRRRLVEGRALVRYVLGERPPPGLVRRYARAVAAERDPRPLDLPEACLAFPALLRGCEPVGAAASRSLLRRRLDLATAIAEMTPEGALRFHAYEPSGRLAVMARLVRLAAGEAIALVLRPLGARRQARW